MSNWLINFIKNLFSKKTEKVEYKDGLIPSPLDFRDVRASDILGSIDLAPLPETYRIPYVLPVKDQGSTPACVGFSCASIKDEKERREQKDVEFDGEWIYRECKKIDNYDGPGTYFRTGLQILQTLGAKPTPTSPVQGAPASFKIGWYIQVDCDLELLKRAIYQWGAILVGFKTYFDSWNTAYIKKGTVVIGAHATVLIGWNKDYLIGQNSSGKGWGDRGLFYAPADYLPFESWAVVSDIPTELLPDPNQKPKHTFRKDLFITLRDTEVRILDECLKWLGCEPKDTESNDYFGKPTQDAVKIFQKRYNINGTGRVGPLTKMALNKIFS